MWTMDDGKIHIPARKRQPAPDGQPVSRLTAEAYNVLVEIYNESQLSMKQIASAIILQSADRIVMTRRKDRWQK